MTLVDSKAGLEVELSYTVFEAFDAVIRSTRIVNASADVMTLRSALSVSVDLPHDRFDLLQLSGAWARERYVHRRALTPGTQSVESRRGSSSHMNNPFFALLSEDANEDVGEVFGFSLVYSGSFVGGVEVDQFHTSRAYLGINPFDFSWRLEPGSPSKRLRR